MLKIFSIISLTFLFACNSNDSSKNDTRTTLKSYEDLAKENSAIKPKSDTIALGFVFGQSEKEVEKHFISLVDQKKVESKSTWELSMLGTTINLTGYPYELFLSDTVSCKTIISYGFYKDKLATLTFFGRTSVPIDEVRSLLENKFGTFQTTKSDSSSYTPKLTYYWFDGYKQIALTESPVVSFAIEYTDIRTEIAKMFDKISQDSIDAVIHKQKSESSKSDLK